MLFVNNGYFSNNFPYNVMLIDSSVDCGTNEELFLALAALRDDNDYMQYFKAAESDKPLLCKDNLIEEYTVWHELYKKMTVQELIEYFNRTAKGEIKTMPSDFSKMVDENLWDLI